VRIEHFDAQEDGDTFVGYFQLTASQDAELTILEA